jgi:hypothetical protein
MCLDEDMKGREHIKWWRVRGDLHDEMLMELDKSGMHYHPFYD